DSPVVRAKADDLSSVVDASCSRVGTETARVQVTNPVPLSGRRTGSAPHHQKKRETAQAEATRSGAHHPSIPTHPPSDYAHVKPPARSRQEPVSASRYKDHLTVPQGMRPTAGSQESYGCPIVAALA